ncbi:MAG TPA: imidazole glycerol phosphate synthase subunit HisH [Methanothermobacter sp.]|nr:imidazole glycerol phosphate synthase subunit HisH [Methanothermobacter sp.]
MIAIIDYGSGNLKSIHNGFRQIGAKVQITQDKKELAKADALILPGMGAFGTAMENLSRFEKIIRQHIHDEKPFLGVCLGLQVLFGKSEESPGINGLDVLPGKVLQLPERKKNDGLKVPQMGWNNLNILKKSFLLKNIENNYMYFTHSYYMEPDDDKIVIATVIYGLDVPAIVAQDNVFAAQFHPEKSGKVGLKILKNFFKLV